jgi:hypothetical protein
MTAALFGRKALGKKACGKKAVGKSEQAATLRETRRLLSASDLPRERRACHEAYLPTESAFVVVATPR